jgi:hypothetical protein
MTSMSEQYDVQKLNDPRVKIAFKVELRNKFEILSKCSGPNERERSFKDN